VKSGQELQGSKPQAVYNYYIYGVDTFTEMSQFGTGGQGGTGGQEGDQGGGGGTGESPVIHQHFMMNTRTSSAAEAPQVCRKNPV
jgi:hypothetical protein